MMWLYIPDPAGPAGDWLVGFYRPDGTWHTDTSYRTREAAARRVHWLNGGPDDDMPPTGLDEDGWPDTVPSDAARADAWATPPILDTAAAGTWPTIPDGRA